MSHESDVFYRCIGDGTPISYYGDISAVQNFVDIVTNASPIIGDHPDIVFPFENNVLIVEHFEFDSYPRQKGKGSKYHREKARIDQRFVGADIPDTGLVIKEVIQGESSYKNYISNVESSFLKHYSEIDKYKEGLEEKGVITSSSIVRTMFFIEDVSPLGSIVGSNAWDKNIELITLARCPEFLDLLKCHETVDYVLTTTYYDNKTYNWFIDRAQIDIYCDNALDYAHMEFVSFTPHVVSAQIPIDIQKRSDS